MFDLDFARSQFPAFSAPALKGWGFFENAGGSYACARTIAALNDVYTQMKVQPYHAHPAARRLGERMDESRVLWAGALGLEPDEVHFGPSTSQNAYVLERAFADLIGPGDEIVVTNQDHEANSGAWRRLAEARGAKLKEWRVEPQSGRLLLEHLAELLSPRVKLVTAPHCSNILGRENPVAEIVRLAHEAGALAVIDGVSWAPHAVPDVGALGADVYLFSLYKVFGVHQGLMAVRRPLFERLPNQGHFFNAGLNAKRLVPAGPDHAQVAAAGAVVDYIDDLAARHALRADSPRARAAGVSALWRAHETALLAPLLDWLARHPRARVLGSTEADARRAPTISLATERAPAELAAELAKRSIMAGAGHFYAYRLLEALGLDPERGVLRLSFVHYTSPAEVDSLMKALDAVL